MSETQDSTAGQEVIEIPQTALVACPEHGFRFARVEGCGDCPYFAGLQDRFPGGPHAFAVRYTVLCKARPTSREIKELA